MLKLPLKIRALPFPWRTETNQIKITPFFLCRSTRFYHIHQNGLWANTTRRGKGTRRAFQITTNHRLACRGPPRELLYPETQHFIETLADFGAKPITLHRDKKNWIFVFWFDISSRRNKAYYCLSQDEDDTEHGLFPEVLCKKLDRTIIENVHAIDHALYTLIEKCTVPTSFLS